MTEQKKYVRYRLRVREQLLYLSLLGEGGDTFAVKFVLIVLVLGLRIIVRFVVRAHLHAATGLVQRKHLHRLRPNIVHHERSIIAPRVYPVEVVTHQTLHACRHLFTSGLRIRTCRKAVGVLKEDTDIRSSREPTGRIFENFDRFSEGLDVRSLT
jgi:hypothetical protein